MTIKPKIFILDVDGVLTPGNFFYSSEGKVLKEFGADDFEMLKVVSEHMDIHFITGDLRGFPITQKRLETDLGYPVTHVPADGEERWRWIKETYPYHTIVFMGDGCRDFKCLQRAAFSITTPDAMAYNRSVADFVTIRTGGRRAVAEACMAVITRYHLKTFLKPAMLEECRQERRES